ncbi:MAG TPA: hypothetical protein VHH36_04560, partial [Candidatus Thermoplasmatota archaeon]|nr:hypothetical protein [Candidatus Thermoplasmatota archaeon]
ATPVLAGPGAFLTGYASPVALSLQGQSVQFASADSVVPHNVVSDGAGPDGRPLFRSATTGLGTFVVPVLGTEALPPGDYPFRCAIHPESMTGRLTVLPLP